MNRRRQTEASLRFEERRKQEDDAPRLIDQVPQLQTLRVEIGEYRDGVTTPQVEYVKHIVVRRAPALFRLPCGDPDCTDGGYDITRDVLRQLGRAAEEFTGEDRCLGSRNGATCNRTLQYIASARYGSS